MKKILTLIIAAFTALVVLSSCGTAINMAPSLYYVGEGQGVSMDKSIALQKAVDNAYSEISSRHNSSVNRTDRHIYASNEMAGKDKTTESLIYESNGSTATNSTIHDPRIRARFYAPMFFKDKKWRCNVTVYVPKTNVN